MDYPTYGGADHEEYCGGDHWLEHCEYEANAGYDYMREAYGAEADAFNEGEYRAEMAYQAELHAADVAAFGPYVEVAGEVDDEIPF